MRFFARLLPLLFFVLTANQLFSQSCFSTGINGSVINLPCNVACTTLKFQVPHLKSTEDYNLVTIPYNPFPYTTSGPALTLPCTAQDDKYFDTSFLPFTFCFFGQAYTKCVVSTNGLITFDTVNAFRGSNYSFTAANTLPSSGSGTNSGTSCNNASYSGTLFPRASIMGPYHDINIDYTTSPNKKMEFRIEGTAPCRRAVISYYQIPMFSCSSLLATHQIVIYESTGLIDVYIENKPVCTGWNGGLAILGIQNWDRDKAVVAPGKNSTQWSEQNTAYRFVPSGATSRFVRAELYTIGGSLLATTGVTPGADTATTTAGLLDLNFPQQCPAGASTQYIVKTYYSSCSDASQLVSTDTVTVNKTTSLQATTANIVASACGPTGAFTVNIPAGAGSAPYTLVLDGGSPINEPGQSHTFTGLTGGAHTLVITTAGGCSQTLTINIPSSGVLTVTATSTATSCNAALNGSVTVTPQNGTSPFQYSLNNVTWQASNVFNNLPPGTYFVYVKDNSGCVLNPTIQVTVAAGAPLTANITANPPACAGAANGSITINPTAGTAPYQYQLNSNPFQSSNTFTNLPTGTYFVQIKDANGCTLGQAVSVSVPASTGSLTATATATGTSCSGVNNGTITITPTAGSSPYQYSLNGGSYQPGTTINNLAPGTYSVVVKDNAGCTSQPISVTVSQGSALLATTATTATSCNGVSNGSITVTPTNGSGPYTYQLDSGTPQSSNVFNNVSAGSHSVVVTDGAGCISAPISVTVSVGPAITGTTATTATSCNGATNGSITVTPTNGSAPYTYSLDGNPFQASNIFSGLAAGSHTIVIKDGVGCTSATITATVAAGSALTGTAVSTATTCLGAANGTITATPDNGNTPYQYQLDGGGFQASNIFNNITVGNHSVVIKDVAGCVSAPISVTVAAGAALAATAATTPTSCSGAINGTITITTTNGTGPFQYSLDGVNFQASNVFSGLAPANYTITFKNNIGCQSTITATVSPGQPLTATVAPNNVLCAGGNSGSATITISTNGAPPYQYSLDGTTWQASNIFNGLTAGNYTVQFKDNNNCAGSQTFVITQPTALTISPAQQAVLCNGQSNGTIIIAANGGTSPYQYSINGTSWQTSNTFNVPAGTYTTYVKDANGCTRTQQVIITEPAVLSATATTANATCDGNNDGTITVTANGGTTGYQYSTDGVNFQSSNVLHVGPGNYTVTIKDANGCTTTTTATVGLTNNLTVTPVADPTICEGLSVQLQPNTNATQFSWTPANGLSANNVRQPIASPNVTTQYIVTATLGLCSANDTIVVNVLPAPIADAGTDGDICYGQTYQLQGSGGVSYQWSPSTYLNTSFTNSPVVTPTQTIQYSLSVTDANGCRSLQPDVVTVHVTPPIVVTISKDTVVAYGDVFQLHASSVATDYTWNPPTGLSDANIPNPMVTVLNDITYTVTATTSAGCKGEASVTLKVYKGPEIYVATAFTPNGDGKNDVFRPFPVGIKNYTYFKVYNRWGQLIFSTYEFNKGWDGTIGGKEQPSGVYVWVVEGITKDNKKISKRGTVTLIR